MAGFMNAELLKLRDNLECGHCGARFCGSDSQARKVKYGRQTVYCSSYCREVSLGIKAQAQAVKDGRKLRKGVLCGPCPVCGKKFESRIDKKFCSLECYNKSPQFKEMLKENYRKGNVRSSEAWEGKMMRNCPVCGKQYRAQRSKRKFCSHLCYRKFKAELFDAWLANPQELVLPQCYDEFMLQEELPCLVAGCNWRGRHLAVHLNTAHGIIADDFKRAVGFNLGTGLVCPDLHKALSDRALAGVAISGESPLTHGEGVSRYVSTEGKESRAKARAIAVIALGPERTCLGCGGKFRQSTIFGRAKYCTITCREKTYRAAKKK